MADGLPKELETALWKQFRDFFAKAERKRRWSLDKDIPWGDCNPNLDPAIADVVESFCAVELFLPLVAALRDCAGSAAITATAVTAAAVDALCAVFGRCVTLRVAPAAGAGVSACPCSGLAPPSSPRPAASSSAPSV